MGRASAAGGLDRVEALDLPGVSLLWIGRDETCQVQLPSSRVSRRHASVECTAEGLRVTDASANGTLVDGLPLRKAVRVVSQGMTELLVGEAGVGSAPGSAFGPAGSGFVRFAFSCSRDQVEGAVARLRGLLA